MMQKDNLTVCALQMEKHTTTHYSSTAKTKQSNSNKISNLYLTKPLGLNTN